MLESLHIKKLKIKIKLLKLHEKIFKMIMIKSLILVNINLKYIHRSNLNSQIFIQALTYLVHFRNLLQVNLCQKLLFLHQLTHNMTTDCSLNYKFNMYMKIPSSNLGRTCCVQKLFLTFRTIFVHNMFSPCSAKRRSSDKDLPVFVRFYVLMLPFKQTPVRVGVVCRSKCTPRFC